MILPILSTQVPAIWPKVLPLLQPAFDIDADLFDSDYILTRLQEKTFQLWVNEELTLAAISEVSCYPKGKLLTVVWVGGKLKGNEELLHSALYYFAVAQSCVRIMVFGRVGFIRRLSNFLSTRFWCGVEKIK